MFIKHDGTKVVDLDGIVEVVECGKRDCNYFLEHGYELLAIETEARFTQPPEYTPLPGQQRHPPYIARSIRYVLGRVSTVDHVEAPIRPGKPKGTDTPKNPPMKPQ